MESNELSHEGTRQEGVAMHIKESLHGHYHFAGLADCVCAVKTVVPT